MHPMPPTATASLIEQPSLSTTAIDAIGLALAEARRSGHAWQPAEAWPEITVADAYAIQAAVAKQLGWFPNGPRAWKVGGTTDISAAPLPEVMQAHAPITWTLPEDQSEVLVEAELAFCLSDTPSPHAPLDEALQALGTVCVSVELIGTRLANGLSAPSNWKLADQGVHASLLVGEARPCAPWLTFTQADWLAQRCHIHVAGGTSHEACGSHPAIQVGMSPLATLPWLLRHAHMQEPALRGASLRSGDVVTTGAWLVVKARRGEVLDIGFAGLPGVQLRIA